MFIGSIGGGLEVDVGLRNKISVVSAVFMRLSGSNRALFCMGKCLIWPPLLKEHIVVYREIRHITLKVSHIESFGLFWHPISHPSGPYAVEKK